MATLGELMDKFAAASENDVAPAEVEEPTVNDDGATKIASGGDEMKSLTDIYLALTESDFDKEAAAVAAIPEDEVDFAKMAEQLAEAEAYDLTAEPEVDMTKVAAEYDAAGRIMARGFFHEFNKLAGNMDTDVSPNQMTESPSAASTPALGERGLPTVETNFAGNEAHDGKIETAGPGPKEVYKNSLKPNKSISAGVTKDDPEAAAVSMGGGSGGGAFATVQDLVGGKPA